MIVKSKLIKINLNQTISRFELAEIQNEQNRWKIFAFICSFFFLIIIFNFFVLAKYNGLLSDRLDDASKLIGDANLIINYKTLKIKAKKWRWDDSLPFQKKFFKGKFKKNNINILLQARGLGYSHTLEGIISDSDSVIFLTFTSTHTEINERYGDCKFKFVKD